MVVKKLVKKEAEVEEENESESESEIEFDYNDNDDDDDEDNESSEEESDDDDDPETEDSEDDEPETTQTTEKKGGKTSKLKKRSAESGDDEANDASNEDDDDEKEVADSTTEQPKKKKRKKMSKLEKSADDSSDDGENDEAGDGESGEEEDDESDEEEEEEEDEEVKAHAGFADALSKILGKKTVSTKKVILALGKTDREIKQIKESKLPPEERETKEKFLTPQELEEQKMKRKLWLEMGKVKPNALERNHEKDLKMIATRGVVQLFNAVKKQQKLVNDNLSDAHTVRKKDMVIESMNKKSFINLLQNTKVDVSMATAEKETIKAKEPERKIWSVLKDDFVIGTGKMKDWDKQDDIDL